MRPTAAATLPLNQMSGAKIDTLLFCTCYARDETAWQSRYQRWIDYYEDGPIDWDRMFLIDDGSPHVPTAQLIGNFSANAGSPVPAEAKLVARFPDNLGRQGPAAYPGWWRSFFHSLQLARLTGASKIVHIESDAYILSQPLADFINEVSSGWHVLWSPRYRMPETAIQVICADQFAAFERFQQDPGNRMNEEFAENILPFTAIHKEFVGDRYSELKRNRGIFRSKKFDRFPVFQRDFFRVQIPDDADFATQVVSRQHVRFRAA